MRTLKRRPRVMCRGASQAAEKRTQDLERQLAALQSAQGVAGLAARAASADAWQHQVPILAVHARTHAQSIIMAQRERASVLLRCSVARSRVRSAFVMAFDQ